MEPNLRPIARPLFAAALLLVVPHAWLRTALIETSWYNPDEFQHLHIAFEIARGALSYRDFYDPHGHLFHILWAPLLSVLNPEASYASAISVVSLGRMVSWTLSLVLVAQVFFLGRRLRGTATGAVAAAFCALTPTFLYIGNHIRPDVPAACLLVAAIDFLLRETSGPERKNRNLLLSGLLCGLAAAFTPKVVLAAPGIAGALAIHAFGAPLSSDERRRRLALTAGFVALAAAPIAMVGGVLAARGAWSSFVEGFLIANLTWPGREFYIRGHIRPNAGMILLAAAGVAIDVMKRKRGERPDMTISLLVISLIGGVFVMQEPTPQYLYLCIPFVALVAADAFAHGAALFLRERGPRALRWVPILAFIALALPGYRYRDRLERMTNGHQRDLLKFVMDRTAPDDRVLDGVSGAGAFRRAAHHHFFIHMGTRDLILKDGLDPLLAMLADDARAPRVVVLDENLGTLPIRDAVLAHYERTENALVWVRKAGQDRSSDSLPAPVSMSAPNAPI